MKNTMSKQIKLITLSSVFCGLTVLSTTSLAYKSSVEEKHNHNDKVETLKSDDVHDHEKGEGSHDKNEHGHNNEKEANAEEHKEGISFSPEKMALANIKVSILTSKVFAKSVYAPGEIKANGYTSYIVSPRTESVVVNRHAILGEHVEKGQPLVTLFSESMAEAQATYRVAYSEWQRTKKLSKGTISESRLLKSETDYNSAFGRLTAFGLTKVAITDIVKNNSSNLGEYTLVASDLVQY